MRNSSYKVVVKGLCSTLQASMSRFRVMRNQIYFIILFALISLLFLLLMLMQGKRAEKLRHFSATIGDFSLLSNNGDQNRTIYEQFDDYTYYTFKLRQTLNCEEKHPKLNLGQKGVFIVLYNFVKGTKMFGCHETVTYTTPADYTFLDNLPTLVQRWKGPISVALYAPGEDFNSTVRSIAYLRTCLPNSHTVREIVTFHLFFHEQHVPKIKQDESLMDSYVDRNICEGTAPYNRIKLKDTYRRRHNLTFPINVARNIARQSAQTHYVFAADIELYPSMNLINNFLGMLSKHTEYIHGKNPRVFVLPIFEIKKDVQVPENKTALQELYKISKAQLFHKYVCRVCHSIPNLTQWINTKESGELDIFVTAKRMDEQRVWEAFYIGTKEDPLFDERLNWEGQGNKMSQGFSMCLLNYDYMVLNNAFIIHKPGIKRIKEQNRSFRAEVSKSNSLLKKEIKPLLISLYGVRKGCYL